MNCEKANRYSRDSHIKHNPMRLNKNYHSTRRKIPISSTSAVIVALLTSLTMTLLAGCNAKESANNSSPASTPAKATQQQPTFEVEKGGSGSYGEILVTIDDIQEKEGGGYQVWATFEFPNTPTMKIRRADKDSKYKFAGYSITIEDINWNKAKFLIRK